MFDETPDNYASFLDRKSQLGGESGFAPVWEPDFLFDFQRHLVEIFARARRPGWDGWGNELGKLAEVRS